MVYLTTATGSFHARVLVARLGSAGILTELRGEPSCTYPLGGAIEVFVEPDRAVDAHHILLADALDAALAPEPTPEEGATSGGMHRAWLHLSWVLAGILIALYLMASFG